jgi:arylsulfatase A-like enzyme
MSSVALVVLDTLRKDAFDQFFDWLPGMRFENAWSTSHWTVPAHSSLFTGKYASEVNTYARNRHLNCDEDTIAEVLSESGITTRGFTTNAAITSEFNFDRGFEEFEGSWHVTPFNENVIDWSNFGPEVEGIGKYPKAMYSSIVSEKNTLESIEYGIRLFLRENGIWQQNGDLGGEEALSYISKSSFGPDEFLFINLMEAHGPYKAPKEYRTVESDSGEGISRTLRKEPVDESQIREAYDDCVRYLSDIYRSIFDQLNSHFDYIITLGDHGELFGEHDVFQHDYGIYPELTNIPLCITTPENTEESIEEIVSILDVHKTIANIFDVSIESRGQDLLDTPESRTYLTEYHGIPLQGKIDSLYEEFPSELVEKYDQPLAGIVCPEDYYGYQTIDEFVETGNATLQSPQAELDRLKPEPSRDTESKELSGDMKARLKDLGYL